MYALYTIETGRPHDTAARIWTSTSTARSRKAAADRDAGVRQRRTVAHRLVLLGSDANDGSAASDRHAAPQRTRTRRRGGQARGAATDRDAAPQQTGTRRRSGQVRGAAADKDTAPL
jgi:hypothetical protein